MGVIIYAKNSASYPFLCSDPGSIHSKGRRRFALLCIWEASRIDHLSLCFVLDEQFDDCKYREHIDELGKDFLAHMACDGTADHHGDDD